MRGEGTEKLVPHTMSRMGDVLAGIHAAWEFESDSVLIRYERGIRTPKLFQALGERRVPLEAIEGVTLTPGKRGSVVLRLEPRPGADPLMEAAAGQLKESSDPYRLVLPAERETLAEYYADELRDRLTESGPAERHLVAAPEAPLQFKAYDGKATFDGTAVAFRWFWTGASSAKWKAGDQRFPIAELGGVEWRSPEVFEGSSAAAAPGHGGAGTGAGRPGPRRGGVRAGVRARARVAAVRGGRAGRCAGLCGGAGDVVAGDGVAGAAARRDPADIAERIRHLGELHQAGLVTDEEFSAKKAELLAEL